MIATRVIGVGNRLRRDDGAGLAVADALAGDGPAGLDIRVESGEGAALIESWRGAGRIFLVDAVSAGQAPGTISRIDAHADPLPGGFFRYSTHAFSLAEAVELARALDELPPVLVVYGIQGAEFGPGEGLSPAVRAAIAEVRHRIAAEIADGGP